MKRPQITNVKTGSELKRWYWLKKELVDFCKKTKINYSGSKFTILSRLANAIDHPTRIAANSTAIKKIKKRKSNVWSGTILTLDTVITDRYTNGANTRKFFMEKCGNKFHFSIPFMAYMKNNVGKTLRDAVGEWERIQIQLKDKNFESKIPEGNQYNQYIRDFFKDNPGLTLKDARHFWSLKRSLPSERHKYEQKDLALKSKK